MAIFNLSVTTVSRSQGRSAAAAAAYQSGARIEDDRTGEVHDYRRRSGVEHVEIVSPDSAPEWAADRSKLWNAAEAKENRRNSVVAREWRISLPHELDVAERIDHRSLEAQEIDAVREADEAFQRGDTAVAVKLAARADTLNRAPEPKLGPARAAMERRAQREAREAGRGYTPVTLNGAEVFERGARCVRRGAGERREPRASDFRRAQGVAGAHGGRQARADRRAGRPRPPQRPAAGEPP